MKAPLPSPLRWLVSTEDAGVRLDQLVARRVPGCSRRQAINLIASGRVRVDERRARKGLRVLAGSAVAVELAGTGGAPELPEQAFLVVTEAVVVVDKPAGLPCHGLLPDEKDTLLEAVARRFPEVLTAGPDPREGGLLHRLDVDTSGCVALARDPAAHAGLRAALAEAGALKRYLAVVHDENTRLPAQGCLDSPLGRARGDDGRMVVQGASTEAVRGPWLPAETRYRLLGRAGGLALLRVEIARGRMHQIRAHLAAAGHPLVGDHRYGHGSDLLPRHALHAWVLGFATTGHRLEARAPIPAELRLLLQRAGLQAPEP